MSTFYFGTAEGGLDFPIGTVIYHGDASAPDNHKLTDGTAYSRSTYADLYAIIGDTYGAGDGSSTFNVPNTIDRSQVCAGSTYNPGDTGGATTVTTDSSTTAYHRHTTWDYYGGGDGGGNTHKQAILNNSGTSGSGTAHANLALYFGLPGIIKAE